MTEYVMSSEDLAVLAQLNANHNYQGASKAPKESSK